MVLGHAEFLEGKTHERHLREFNFTRSLIGAFLGMDVLDIGFGRGDHIPFFLKEGITSYTGIDFSPSTIEIVQENFNDHRLHLFEMDATQLDAEGAFDLVIMYDVVEHIPVYEMEIIWPKIHRALRRCGYVVLSTPLFENPNITAHSDEILSVSGMHCNKETRGTLLRSFITHGFTVALSENRVFGIVRTEDLPFFEQGKREAYLKQQALLFEEFGISDFEGILTKPVAQTLVPGAGRVVMGCVADNNPKYLSQTHRLLESLRWFGGSMAGANFFVCFVEEINSYYAQEFERIGAFIRKIPRFSKFHPHSNKLCLLDLPELMAYDTIMLLDCDTIIVQDPWPFLDGKSLQAKIADLPTVPHDAFSRLFEHFNLSLPPQEFRCTFDGSPTVWYCNSGVLVFPVDLIKSFVPIWRDYNLRLSNNLDLLSPHQNFCDQASLSLAFAAHPVPFKELPVSMNFPLHLTHLQPPPEMAECDPVILHYHDRVDDSGYLQPSPYNGAQRRIELFNERLKGSRKKYFDNRLFWDFRYSQYPDMGSGVGSKGEVLNYKREILRELIGALKPRTIIDIGCGDCAVTEGLFINSYTGIDISDVVIRHNQDRMPWRKFICGDFLNLELDRSDMVLCFDVLIHLSDPKAYQSFVERLVTHSGRCGIVSGFEEPTGEGEGMVFFHEPLSLTLKRYGARSIKKIGRYRKVMIWYYEGAALELSKDDAVIISGKKLHEPVFLIGTMRSGTTLLADLLGRFPGIVHCPFELKDIWSSAGGVPMASAKTRDMVCYEMDAEDIRPRQAEKLGNAFTARMHQNSEGKTKDAVFLNKNPHLCNKLPFVNALFPDARFIWLHRPMPQVVGSLKRLFEDVFNRQQTWHYWPVLEHAVMNRCWYAFHQKDFPKGLDPQRVFPGGDINFLAEYWLESNRAASGYLSTLSSDRWVQIEEEALINDPETQIRYCLDFLKQSQEISSEIFKGLDPSRNIVCRSSFSGNELYNLRIFIETHKTDIENVFPTQGYAFLNSDQANAASKSATDKAFSKRPKKLHNHEQRPVCITGMHRSGTSMIARLLNICGLYLGRDNDLMNSQSDNPEGFWENIHFVNLNDEILGTLDGAWDLPPRIKKGWEKQPEFKSLYNKASILLQKFKDHELWGWKDPRTCLTIPFWNGLIRNLKFVICIRAPIEVARSLQKRGGNSNTFGLNLWSIYNQQLLSFTEPHQRIITHYESYFINPEEELKRIFDFLQWHISEKTIDRACGTIDNALRHHVIGNSSITFSLKIAKLYEKLCAEAGSIYRQMPSGKFTETDNPTLASYQPSDENSQWLFHTYNQDNQVKNRFHVSDLEPMMKEKDDRIMKLESFIKNYEKQFLIDLEELKKKALSAVPANSVMSGIDRFAPRKDAIEIEGWACIKGQSSENSEIFILFVSEKRSYTFKTSRVKRPDVTAHFKTLNYDDSGFSAFIPPILLEAGEYHIFICIKKCVEKDSLQAFQFTNKKVIISH